MFLVARAGACYWVKRHSFSAMTLRATQTLTTSVGVCFWPVLGGGAWQEKLSLTTMASVSAAGESRLPTHTWPALLSFTEPPAASLRMGHCLCHCLPPTPSQSPYPANHSVLTPISPPPSNIQKPSDMAASNIHNSYAATQSSQLCWCSPIWKSSLHAAGAVAEHRSSVPSQ